MKLSIEFKHHNEEYDQNYADEFNGGEESENNSKYKWRTGFEVDDIVSFDFKENQSVKFLVNLSGVEKEIKIENLVILECVHDEGSITKFGVSKSILKRFHQTKGEKHKKTYAYFYIKGESEFALISDAYCIDVNELPNPQDN